MDKPPAMSLSPVQIEFRRALLHKLGTGEYQLEQVPTCLCGERDTILLAEQDRYGIPVGVVLCPACGLARTSPRLAAANLSSFYEVEYHGLHQSVRTPQPTTVLYRAGQGRAIAGFLRDLLPEGQIRVADVGCGTGQVLREFQAALGENRVMASGCEYSRAFVDAGRSAGSDVKHGGPEALLPLAPFDVVLLSHVVEHFPEPVQDLAMVRRLGHEATYFYVEVPGLLTIDHKREYAFRLDQYLTLAHTYHFSLATLTATMARAGFELVRGDEGVRSVFRQSAAHAPAPDPSVAAAILESLRGLHGWRMGLRRIVPRIRQLASATARRLPDPLYRRLRRL